MQMLAQVPVLWVWDNVEPVTGFPAGTPSAWTPAEQQELADLVRDLTLRTRCKVLLTSRRVRYAAGNPLTITVLVGQALRESLVSSKEVEDFVARLRAGEARLEGDGDAALGRTRSLAASLDYGFAHAFTNAERAQLAVLHLFRDTVDVDALRFMGDSVPELAGLTREAGIALLDRAADIGLLTSMGGGYYQIHPALPWYFTGLFTSAYGQAREYAATHAYTKAFGYLSTFYAEQVVAGRAIAPLRVEEANLLHALNLARGNAMWPAAAGCLRGLEVLYERTGREGEWARLITDVGPDFVDSATGGPLPGREEQWDTILSFQARLAEAARDWPSAISLLTLLADRRRARVAEIPAATITAGQRHEISTLAAVVGDMGRALQQQGDSSCLSHLQEAHALHRRIGDRTAEAETAGLLGNTYLRVPGLRDLGKAERWFRHGLSLRPDSDRYGRARSLSSLGGVALERFHEASAAKAADSVLLAHLNDALRYYQQSLDLTPADDHKIRGISENQLGAVYQAAGHTDQALVHYQRSIRHKEAREDSYAAGQTRYNVANVLATAGRFGDALRYARAALDNFRQVGVGAAERVDLAERLIAELERVRPEGLPCERTQDPGRRTSVVRSLCSSSRA